MAKLIDKFGRIHNYLRFSITDKCNLNCVYCNPKKSSNNIKSSIDLLTDEEIIRISTLFLSKFEFNKIRLTGGEPFARKNINSLIEKLGNLKKDFNFELTATTNGTLLNGNINSLFENGLDRLNFSIDSLKNGTFKDITGFNKSDKTLNAIMKAKEAGFKNIKLNTVVMKGINDNEINDFVEFAINNEVTVRFIEYMPFTNNDYDKSNLITMSEIISIIKEKYEIAEIEEESSVAKEFKISNSKGRVSIISSISDHFCGDCNRIRITSDGYMKLCLFSPNRNNLSIKKLIDNNYNDDEIAMIIQDELLNKTQSHADLKDLMLLENNNMVNIGG